jgi:hypothetical protein
MAAPLVELALDYYRDPLAYRHLAEAERPLPQGFGALLAEFCTALSSARIAQTAAQLSADPGEMEEAARFFVRHVLLSPAGDFYRHLGLNRDAISGVDPASLSALDSDVSPGSGRRLDRGRGLLRDAHQSGLSNAA